MKRVSTGLNSWLWLPLGALFGVILWQAATLPLTAAEAVAWDKFVRPHLASLFVTPGGWSGLLYALLVKRAVGLFRLSEFTLRLPDVLAGGIYLAAFFRLACSVKIARHRWWLAPLAILPVFMHYFSFAGGLGIALGFCAMAVSYSRFAGLWFGLALAAAPQFGIFWAILASGFLPLWGFWKGMERVLIPATATAFIFLLIPLSHGGQPLPSAMQASASDFAVRSAVEILHRETGTSPVRIATSLSVQAPLSFYRERYQRRNWLIDRHDPQYFLWLGAIPPALFGARTILLDQDGVVLAR
jgi:hypothetical protein